MTGRADGGGGGSGRSAPRTGRRGHGTRAARVALAAALAAGLLGTPAPAPGQDADRGQEIYETWCAGCHGVDGEGDGPAASRMLPRPRDFTEARYQIRTTASGDLPADEDLMEVLDHGLPGTTMPGWPNLSTAERRDVVAYLKELSPFFEQLGPPEQLDFGDPPGGGEEAVEAGREVYERLECDRCHGAAGRGDGPSAPTLEDWQENPVRAADLTKPWLFNGGGSVEEVHRRFLTGLDGTPMPTQSDALDAGVVDSTDLWNLTYYVRSLGPERSPPRMRDAARVPLVEEGELPSDPGADAWQQADRYWFPLSGQVIEPPRQFEPMVPGVWVRGLHDGDELALRVSWSDPSPSPDSAWMEWQRKVADLLHDDGEPWPTDSLPDRLAVQFPTAVPEGRERPYFLMGSSQRPVYLLRWNSRDGFREAAATGLGTSAPLGESRLEGEAEWSEGRWSVVFRRPLEGEGDRISFPPGTAVPAAYYAWDGNNAEDGTRGAISGWFFLVLETPTGTEVYAAPAVVVLLIGGIGFFLTRRVRASAGGGGSAGSGAG